ncbi:MAG: FprA family A-type flavoprotein [Lachnospiraceae bacterium]|nr:FprA family A-type flavoprotein [Lachnospiraceae bacterium]
MKNIVITDNIKYIGVDDKDIDLFEGQYVVPNGISYNSYLILDEKVAVMDTVDMRACEEWLENLKKALNGRTPDYLIVSHLEPDHAGSVAGLISAYPNVALVGNAKTFSMLPNFFDVEQQEKLEVKEGDTLTLGRHTLQFFMAPMVHWPEVMVTYEQTEKILFAADGFGKFGALDTEEDWTCEARRYYFNIVGKYGAPVQALLKKAAGLDISMICPLHGPILKENLGFYIEKYDIWSSYKPEDSGVFIAYASIHGNTAKAAHMLKEQLLELGVEKVAITDLARDDMAEAVEDAFRYDRMVLAASSYDGGLFPPMEDFLMHLKAKTYQNRKVAIVENGSWAPSAAKKMKEYLEGMKDICILEPIVTIKSTVRKETEAELQTLAEVLQKA